MGSCPAGHVSTPPGRAAAVRNRSRHLRTGGEPYPAPDTLTVSDDQRTETGGPAGTPDDRPPRASAIPPTPPPPTPSPGATATHTACRGG
ncbi:hypothetical protein GCM10010246_14150 [Streptomyces cuspidosporus]|uniref:Uncharacterized protein n=1 Tax=Streptomyces cuspidosporus TaxID=66882 RepID=A0ABN3FJX4_9ACTN